ncbi:uncharacterized protein DDB_G0289917-like [Gordionus sp. m RMFG-2023]|uniref:uncharacterized protein DDB_G0289917-like n=1 Tax=Gordionus sp. m RMFG-2023 TaxID=3053472 RepID=UPI0031FBC65A
MDDKISISSNSEVKFPKLERCLTDIYLERLDDYFSQTILSDSVKIETLMRNLSDDLYDKIKSLYVMIEIGRKLDSINIKSESDNVNYVFSRDKKFNKNNDNNRNNDKNLDIQSTSNRNEINSNYNRPNYYSRQNFDSRNRNYGDNKFSNVNDNRNRNFSNVRNYNNYNNNNYRNNQHNDSNYQNYNYGSWGNKVGTAKDNNENDLNVNNLAENTDKGDDSAFMTTLKLNNVTTTMQVDTGSKYTIIPHDMAKKIGIREIKKSSLRLTPYDGNLIKIIGTTQVKVSYEGITKYLLAVVLESRKNALLGRIWINAFKNILNKFIRNVDTNYEDEINKLIKDC